MSWLDKINVFKRLKNQAELIHKLSAELEELNAPVFYFENYSPGDHGPSPIPLSNVGQMPEYPEKTLIDLMRIAETLITDGVDVLRGVELFILTDRGVFCADLDKHGEILELRTSDQEVYARIKFDTIEIGQKVTIFTTWVVLNDKRMVEIENCRNMYLWPGDALNLEYTFQAP
jgi:hypothetical protein